MRTAFDDLPDATSANAFSDLPDLKSGPFADLPNAADSGISPQFNSPHAADVVADLTRFRTQPAKPTIFDAINQDVVAPAAKGARFVGKALVGGLADIGSDVTGQTLRDQAEQEAARKEALRTGRTPSDAGATGNVQALAEGEPMPAEEQSKFLPTPLRVAERASQGLIESAPQLAAVAGFEALGVPAPVSAAVVFGSTENGFDTKQAAIAAAVPFVGKYSGDIVQAIAKRYGVSSERALQIFNTAGGAGGATTFLAGMQAVDIAKLPTEQRKDAIIEAIAANIGQLPLALAGHGAEHEQPAAAVTPDLAADLQSAMRGNQIKEKPAAESTENAAGEASPSDSTQPEAPRNKVHAAVLDMLKTGREAELPPSSDRADAEKVALGSNAEAVLQQNDAETAKTPERGTIVPVLDGPKAEEAIVNRLTSQGDVGVGEFTWEGIRKVLGLPISDAVSVRPFEQAGLIRKTETGNWEFNDNIQNEWSRRFFQKTAIPAETGTIVPPAELTAGAEAATTEPGAAAETITGQNERVGSEATAETTSAAEPMPAEGESPQRPRPASKPKSGFFLRPRADGVPDILDSIQELGGIRPPGEYSGGEYDGFREAMVGPARVLIRRTAKHAPDTLIDELKAIGAPGAERLHTADDLWKAVTGAVKGREGLRKAGFGEREQAKSVSEFQRRAIQGQRPKKEAGKFVAVHAGKMLEGDRFEVQGHSFTVQHLEFDEASNLVSVEVKDGPKFGVQHVDGNEVIHVDKGSFEAGPEHGAAVPPELGPAEKRNVPDNGEVGGKTSGPPLELNADPIEKLLNKAIEKTKPEDWRKNVSMGVLKFPVWLTQEAVHGALKVVRAAYQGGKKLAEAIDLGVQWLRSEKLNGFNEDEARAWLSHATQSDSGFQRLPEDQGVDVMKRRQAEIDKRLSEIGAQAAEARKHFATLPDDVRSERYQLAKEGRAIQLGLLKKPEYVADLLRRQEVMLQDVLAARKAGDQKAVREAMNTLIESPELQFMEKVDPDLLERVRKELEARGEITPLAGNSLPAGRTLGDLTTWLKQNRLGSPKLSLRERFNLTRRLTDEWNRGKDALTRISNKMRSAWEAFKEQYKAPPVDDEFRSLLKDWFYEKQWTGLETHKWVDEIRREIPNRTRREALAIWLDAGGDQELLRSQADLVPDRFKPAWRAALELNEKERAFGRRLQLEFEQKLSDAQTLGLIEQGRENYGVPQLWKVDPKNEGEYDPTGKKQSARNTTAKLDPRDPFFSLHRTTPSYFDGIMNGGVPKSLDVGDLVGIYNMDFHNALADRGVIKALKDSRAEDGTPIVRISGAAHIEPRPEGARSYFVDSNWKPEDAVTADGRPYRAIDHWALRGWKFASQSEEGNPILVQGDFLVHPDYFQFLKNELGKSWLRDPEGGGKYFDALLKNQAFLKASKFASATFHMATLAEHSAFHAIAGKPNAERLSLLWPSVRGVELEPGRNPELANLMRHGMELGFGNQRELFEEGLSSHGGIWGRVPGLGAALTRMSDFLFKSYMPKLKAKTAAAMLHANQERYGKELSPEQVFELTANQANAAFGAQNWRLLGTNKTMLDVNRLLLTAPDFLLSRSKVVGQAFKPYNAEQRNFLIAQAALVYVGARILNQLLDGQPHWEAANALRVVSKGKAYGARFLVSDIAAMVQDFPGFAAGRLGPYPRTAFESLTGRDMRTGARKDVLINTDNPAFRAAQIALQDFASWLIPVGVEGVLPGAVGREQTGPGQVALALSGVGSRKYTAETQMWDAATQFNRNSQDAKTQLYQKTRDDEAKTQGAYRKLDDLLDAGDLKAAAKEFQALVDEGHSPKSIEQRFRVFSKPTTRNGERPTVLRPFSGSSSREGAFVQSLTPALRQTYDRAIQERVARAEQFSRMVEILPKPAETPAE
jgi:hypothetical protein